VLAVWVCNNLISNENDRARYRTIKNFVDTSELVQLILNELSNSQKFYVSQSRKIKKEGLWFITNLINESAWQIKDLVTIFKKSNLITNLIDGLKEQRD
jgi:hypothetical protein